MKAERVTIGDVPENVFGMLADLCLKMKKGVILPEHLAMFLKKQHSFPFMERSILFDWQAFFKKYLEISLDLSNLKIPPKQESFDRLIIIPEGITPNKIYEAYVKNFSCWKWTNDLNNAVAHNDREPTKTYAVWVRDTQEADEENENISADRAKERKIQGITLIERLIFGLKYWDETKTHLDVKNLTICSGSRSSAGGVPSVNCCGGEVRVDWCFSQLAHSDWRVRTVVSF